MIITPNAAVYISIARKAGAIDYDVLQGSPETSKVARLRLPNGCPLVLQTNSKTPRLWMLASQEGGNLTSLGKQVNYDRKKSRHWHLDQVREFKGQALIKVIASNTCWPTIESALLAAGSTTIT